MHWNAPDKPNGVITQYVINYTTPGGTTLTNTTNNLFYTIQPLDPFTDYNITVAAETKVGVGPVSECPLSAQSARTATGSENSYHHTH